MFALQPLSPTTSPIPSLTPHLLPTRLSHTGPLPISKRHWDPKPTPPSQSSRITKQSYFRGRRLLSRTVKVPEGYTGYILSKTATTLPCPTRTQTKHEDNKLPVFPAQLPGRGEGESDDDEEEDPLRRMMMGPPSTTTTTTTTATKEEGGGGVKVLKIKGTFHEMEIWGHEEIPSDENAFVRTVEEWMDFARVLHT